MHAGKVRLVMKPPKVMHYGKVTFKQEMHAGKVRIMQQMHYGKVSSNGVLY